jgi:ankyrin repeat protein
LFSSSSAPGVNKPGSTPFHLAAQNTGRGGSGSEQARTAQREILRAFLERGVSPNLTDAKGRSILEWANSDWIHEILAHKAE